MDSITRARKRAIEAELREINRNEAEDKAAAPKVVGEPGLPTERKRLTTADRINILQRQAYCCGNCPASLVLVKGETYRVFTAMIDEHIIPLELGGSNDLSNRALYCVPCAKAKTRDDIKRISKARRQAKLMQPREPSRHRLQSRGFR